MSYSFFFPSLCSPPPTPIHRLSVRSLAKVEYLTLRDNQEEGAKKKKHEQVERPSYA